MIGMMADMHSNTIFEVVGATLVPPFRSRFSGNRSIGNGGVANCTCGEIIGSLLPPTAYIAQMSEYNKANMFSCIVPLSGLITASQFLTPFHSTHLTSPHKQDICTPFPCPHHHHHHVPQTKTTPHPNKPDGTHAYKQKQPTPTSSDPHAP